MRKIIVDTDLCSDDAAALLFALKDENTQVLAVTTVSGGVSLEQATQNALMTCEVAGAEVPVYRGARKGLFKEPFATTAIHGADGMGECGLIHPTTKAVEGVDACDAILSLVRKYPYEIDLIALAPVTNIGLAILKDADTMKKLRSITVMGTGGFGPGNITPVAEANVFTDAESFELLLSLGVKTDILGFDLGIGDSAFCEAEFDALEATGAPAAVYVAKAGSKLLQHNKRLKGEGIIDICDGVAMGCYLWPEIVLEKADCAARVSCQGDTYGQVIFYDAHWQALMENVKLPFDFSKNRCSVFTKIDTALFKQRVLETLTK
jgi:purine nucleosidase